ncbi:MAG: response regulator [Proteobacteria bacterium]|nr:response regulator [Pseudomonadota bacterium]
MRILVVDDEDIVLESCQAVFELEGYEAVLVPSADKALEAMKNNDFDLLLIDVKMPKKDGMYLMRKIKEQWPDIPIIVMSGYYTTETIQEAIRMGAATFIAKPFEPDELIKIVRQVIEKEERHGKKESPRN